jgi:cytochrome b
MYRLRAYHDTLAVVVILAYLTGEAGGIHAWLGYGVAAMIALRLVLALSGLPQLGMFRFYPHFERLKLANAMTHPVISRILLLGIAITLLVATATGIAMDGGRTIGLAETPLIAAAYADDDERDRDGRQEGDLSEVHEVAANVLLLIVAMHVGYLFLFKRPLALFMLFMGAPQSKARRRQVAEHR